jgi:UDP-N-acetylglucosamine:LPS N-acetylglucosamine transferase
MFREPVLIRKLFPQLIAGLLAWTFLAGCASVARAPTSSNSASGTTRTLAAAPAQKVIIFYSSIGSGHISAARAIEKRIREKEPNTQIILKNIRDFMNPTWANVDEKLFWFIVKKYPKTFTRLFKGVMARGERTNRLSDLSRAYDEKALLSFIEVHGPDALLATHYGSALALSNLRADGKLLNRRIGWLHTDYISHYFPRLSKSIDRSFLPHPELEKIWLAAGLDPKKVATTGMPLNPELFKPIDPRAFLLSQGLDPTKKTITIASGAEGVGDFPLIVEKLSKHVKGDLQVVAVCARNEKNIAGLKALEPKLREGVKLVTKGYIPNEELLSFIKSSDLYITKAGGLSPTEAFAIGKPTLIMDIYGGHESENAVLFEKLGLAEVNRNPETIGAQAETYLADRVKLERALEAQAVFRDSLNTDAIVEFALDSTAGPKLLPRDLGLQGGTPVRLAAEALEKLNRAAPGQVEILFSSAISPDPNFKSKDANPFGHIAFRVDDEVYTVNQNTTRENSLFVRQSLHDYLYGITSPTSGAEIGSHFGIAYSRDTYGIRIGNLPAEKLESIRAEITRIDSEWKSGNLIYSATCNNCADITQRVYAASGGISGPEKFTIGMPKETFSRILRSADLDPNLTTEVVSYTRIAGAKNYYAYDRFPVNLYEPLDLLLRKTGLRSKTKVPTSLENRIDFRLGSYPEDVSIHYESPTEKPFLEEMDQANAKVNTKLKGQLEELRKKERELATLRQTLKEEASSESVLRQLREAANTIPQDATGAAFIRKTGPPNAVVAELEKIQARYANFETKYDEYNQRKLLWLLEYYHDNTRYLIEKVNPNLSPNDRAKLKALTEKFTASYLDYFNNHQLYNQPKDVRRIDAFRAFMDGQQKIFDYLKIALAKKEAETKPLSARLAALAKKWNVFRKFLPIVAKILPMLSELKFHANSAPDRSPLVDRINGGFKALGDQLGFKVSTFGKENIPKIADAKTLNFFVIQHSHPQLDNIVLANLGLGPYAIYGAADTFAPKALADLMDRNDHFVVVGRGADKPIDKTLEILQKKTIKNFVIYPEGSVSVGMYDTRAPREKFVTGLLGRLKKEGYRVNLIPISMPKNFRLNNNWMFPTDPSLLKLEARIGKPIDAKVVDALVGTENEQLLNRLTRTIYFENLEAHSGRPFLGMPTMDELLDELEKSMRGGDCHPYLKPQPRS